MRQFCKDVMGHNKLWINRASPLDRDGQVIIGHIRGCAHIEYLMARVSAKGGGACRWTEGSVSGV